VEVINKVRVTAEAAFDYKYCLQSYGSDPPALDRQSIKQDLEQYINGQTKNGRLVYDRYFRCKWFDEQSGQMLMCFLYRGEKYGIMQEWNLSGLCQEGDWSEDAESDGSIRHWLKQKITDLTDEDDWVVACRLKQILMFTDKTIYENVLKEVRDAFKCGGDKETAEKLLFVQSFHFQRREHGVKEKTGQR
jgi:hypothetical protein